VEKALEGIYSNDGILKDRVKGMVCHVGNKADRTKLIEKTLEEFGGLDILISNAAINPHFGPVLEVSQSQNSDSRNMNVCIVNLPKRNVLKQQESFTVPRVGLG
jgi:NAD(P)-dependent dehydrogenase (short-subunit alcohol dehydrogenase family)